MVNGKETTLNPNATASASASALPASTSSTSTSTTSAPSIATESSKSSPGKNHTGAIAGGVVGGLVGLALVAGAMYWLFRPRPMGDRDSTLSKRREHANELDSGTEKNLRHEMPNGEVPYEVDGIPRGELDGGGKRAW